MFKSNLPLEITQTSSNSRRVIDLSKSIPTINMYHQNKKKKKIIIITFDFGESDGETTKYNLSSR